MEYQIIEAISPSSLETKVMLYLKNGWTLRGGLVVFGAFFYQAMTKDK